MRISDWSSDVCSSDLRELGEWSLRSLLVALAITPIARLSGWSQILTARRVVGLIAFTYVLVHWTFWMSLDLAWSPTELAKEIVKRRYILFGMTGFLRSEEHTSELPSLMRSSYAVFCLKK